MYIFDTGILNVMSQRLIYINNDIHPDNYDGH